jgi:hypothetical protein
MTTSAEHGPVRQVALDPCEAWFDGDVARTERALHPNLVKRHAGEELGVTTKERMIELTRQGEGRSDAADRRLEIEVTDVRDDIAGVTVRSAPYLEYLHLVRTSDGWKIANALFLAR